MKVNPNNQPETNKRKAQNADRALSFCRELKNMSRGTQAMQDQKKTILLSIKLNYGLSTRAARMAWKAC